jgi:hypothetical protein
MPWIAPVYKVAILDALKGVERYWRRYSPSALRLRLGMRSGRISFLLTEAGMHIMVVEALLIAIYLE